MSQYTRLTYDRQTDKSKIITKTAESNRKVRAKTLNTASKSTYQALAFNVGVCVTRFINFLLTYFLDIKELRKFGLGGFLPTSAVFSNQNAPNEKHFRRQNIFRLIVRILYR